METKTRITLVSKEGVPFNITVEEAKTSGLLRRMLLDRAVNCRQDILHPADAPSTDANSKQRIICCCYRCNTNHSAPHIVILDRISTHLLQKVCEFMAYKVKTEELISTTMSSTAPSKIRDLCNRIDGFSIGEDSGEILDLLVVADYLDI
ncbi:hypothetical protein DI09_10p400 [Mitosporidium daphniae]|uniref:SKP1 component POZ domain-containing protein n=1 Tax=Mitosporidium daphniae TaxID=1485682 RepID=A0A098VVH4_9MICR|nr:uncharacterized protein DI09_10p400 [Mitosporidium daphniae]KGG53143.1 hypothetical protein DI09_10p400 [Mitosporidium daphniae]|eukprot:XP_013239570.1 uncharacterized protein DI09_10p400 [Mitosporidium daphniae]